MSREGNTCGGADTAGRAAVAVLAFLLTLPWNARAGKLDEVRDAAGGGGDDSGEDGGDNDSGGDDGAGDVLLDAVGEAFADAVFEAAQSRAQNVRFNDYPYAGGGRGWVVDLGRSAPADGDEAPAEDGALLSLEDAYVPQRARLASISLKLSLDYAYDWDAVHRPTGSLSLDTSTGLGLRGDFTAYIEPAAGGETDALGIGSADLMFRAADAAKFAPYVGIGWRYLVDGDALRNGVNGVIAFDVFPVRPLVVSLLAEGGNLGEAGYFHGRATVGALVRQIELFAGYDVVLVHGGGEDVVFHGPTAGVRAWF